MNKQISRDDIQDVQETKEKLDDAIDSVLNGVEKNIAISAFLSTFIDGLLAQAKSIEQLLSYKKVVNDIIDDAICNATKKVD